MSPRHDDRERALVRPHVVTGGRAHPSRNIFELITIVTAVSDRWPGLSPEKRRLMELCRGGALSVAEIAGHLALPVSVTRVLLSDLLDSGHIATLARSSAATPRVQLLQEVLHGLRTRL